MDHRLRHSATVAAATIIALSRKRRRDYLIDASHGRWHQNRTKLSTPHGVKKPASELTQLLLQIDIITTASGVNDYDQATQLGLGRGDAGLWRIRGDVSMGEV